MAINLNNLFSSINKNSKMSDFQDLEHIDGLSISTTSANLYSKQRDDLVLFYFRNGANHASVYTQSKLISENIKWNLKINKKKIKALLINTRNANAFTGKDGFKALQDAIEDMKKTEEDIANKKLTIESLSRQKDIITRLLKVEEALREQGEDEKRDNFISSRLAVQPWAAVLGCRRSTKKKENKRT